MDLHDLLGQILFSLNAELSLNVDRFRRAIAPEFGHHLITRFPSKHFWFRPLFLGEWWMSLGLFETYVRKILKLSEGDYFVDVGANIGYYAVYAAHRVRETGRVICMEPDPRNIRILLRNISTYHCVSIIRAAVGSENRQANFSLAENPLYSSLDREWPSFFGVPFQKEIRVPMITLDSLVDKIGPPNRIGRMWLKIDAEGHELEVVRGGLLFIECYLPTIIVETSHVLQLEQLLPHYMFRQLLGSYWVGRVKSHNHG